MPPPPTIEVDESSETLPPPVLIKPDFFLSNSALRHTNVYTTNFVDPFNSLMSGGIVTDPMAIINSYLNKIQALFEQQMGVCGGRGSLKASIAPKIYYS
jgi:hypothetical protein